MSKYRLISYTTFPQESYGKPIKLWAVGQEQKNGWLRQTAWDTKLVAQKKLDHYRQGEAADRQEAIDRITKEDYYGFSWDQDKWYCPGHAIDLLFNGDCSMLVDYCVGHNTEWKSPNGIQVYAIHEGTISYESFPNDFYPRGLRCAAWNCDCTIVEPLSIRLAD
jgi:hypothetical protein